MDENNLCRMDDVLGVTVQSSLGAVECTVFIPQLGFLLEYLDVANVAAQDNYFHTTDRVPCGIS